ncbi:ImmA/IrrE family metallo-endopeptidase [Anaerococcus sp. AGMB00486]|uniref:ImmA/IrrE family metallo-endopeptidase n=2 Tax=Anaerococcus TaxID=165779 RepID=A0ABX2N9Z0_9FIRM|nr:MULTISPECIES: ImmA/IrrE family metallo-endopeptidase [Anaerococcus]MDY3006815.1 ImmA/IrrE family metallo-endopeptidase [Anaerococcus porci]MSS78270.1 ImmA/IrrE family metallo-endopeptidase [Anaerococcus porci]NVF11384.1 ImmA/IrrE family metallo-endopeptidase [Anaerococcus faecalis]
MSFYDEIFKDVKNIIKKYDTRNPKEILIQRGVTILAFKENTKLLGMYKIIKRNSFVFYNPFVDKRIQNMVFAHELGHDIYHRTYAKDSNLMEYELFDINSEMELCANIFAAHLLLDENKLIEDIKQGYTYNQLASLYNVNVNLMIFKLNEMHRMGIKIKKEEADSRFFKNINGKDIKNHDLY